MSILNVPAASWLTAVESRTGSDSIGRLHDALNEMRIEFLKNDEGDIDSLRSLLGRVENVREAVPLDHPQTAQLKRTMDSFCHEVNFTYIRQKAVADALTARTNYYSGPEPRNPNSRTQYQNSLTNSVPIGTRGTLRQELASFERLERLAQPLTVARQNNLAGLDVLGMAAIALRAVGDDQGAWPLVSAMLATQADFRAQLETQVQALEGACEAAQAQAAELDKSSKELAVLLIEQKNAENAALQKRLQVQDDKAATATEMTGELEARASKLEAELQALQSKLAANQQEINTGGEASKRQVAELQKLKEELAKKQQEIGTVKGVVITRDASIERLKADAQALGRAKQEEVDNHKATATAQDEKIARLDAQVTRLREELNAKTASVEEKQLKLNALQVEAVGRRRILLRCVSLAIGVVVAGIGATIALIFASYAMGPVMLFGAVALGVCVGFSANAVLPRVPALQLASA